MEDKTQQTKKFETIKKKNRTVETKFYFELFPGVYFHLEEGRSHLTFLHFSKIIISTNSDAMGKGPPKLTTGIRTKFTVVLVSILSSIIVLNFGPFSMVHSQTNL